ncbi:MAG: hypothetical protein HFG20_11695 [Anaerotruncus sp.]|nr:hypothetical protein [Anaerotruncus sp.]
MKLSKQERETLIRWDEEGDSATIYTHNPKLQNKLLRFMERHPAMAVMTGYDATGAMNFVIEKKRLAVYPTEPPSEQQRQAAQERMRQRYHTENVEHPENP